MRTRQFNQRNYRPDFQVSNLREDRHGNRMTFQRVNPWKNRVGIPRFNLSLNPLDILQASRLIQLLNRHVSLLRSQVNNPLKNQVSNHQANHYDNQLDSRFLTPQIIPVIVQVLSLQRIHLQCQCHPTVLVVPLLSQRIFPLSFLHNRTCNSGFQTYCLLAKRVVL